MLSGIDKELLGCVNQCTPQEKVCRGCGRSEVEQSEWARYSDSKKRAIKRKIKRENTP
jgi:predicted Fe-S protein YdhL (DUF1289 family)